MDRTFLSGVMKTDIEGMAEFLTIFPGDYASRTTYVHLTVQPTSSIAPATTAFVQHIGQLFFNECYINEVYVLKPYSSHLATLNRTTNSEDALYTSANGNGYSAVISVNKIGDALTDGLVGYITVGVNTSAAGR